MTIKAFLLAWDHWWTRSAPPHTMAIIRILFGIFLLLYWGPMMNDVPMLLSREGILMPLFEYAFLTPPTVTMAYAIFALCIVAILFFTIGLFTRTSAVTILLITTYWWALSLHLTWFTMEHLIPIVLVFVAFGGGDRTYSVAMKLKHGSWTAWEPISVMAQRLLAIQLTATFTGVVLQKAWLPDWQSGEVLQTALMGRWATPIAFWFARLELPSWFYDLWVKTVIYYEMLMPILFWTKWRAIGVLMMVLFLILNTLLLSFWWFLALIPLGLTLWEPEKVYDWLKN